MAALLATTRFRNPCRDLECDDVLNSDINAFWNDTSIVLFVDNNTNSTSGHIKNASGCSMVDLVWHTLLDGTVTFNIDDITLSVACHVGLESDNTLLAKVL